MASTPIQALLGQFSSADKDHRYMATSDLLGQLSRPDWRLPSSDHECSQLCSKVVRQLGDPSGDISALAVRCLVALVTKVPSQHVKRVLEQLCEAVVAERKRGTNSDASSIALKAVLAELPQEDGAVVASTALPILMRGLTAKEDIDVRQDAIEAVHIVVTRFGAHIERKQALVDTFLSEMKDERSSLLKKSATCLPLLAVHMDDDGVAQLVEALLDALRAAAGAEPCAQAHMQALGASAKALGFRFGPHVAVVVPLVIQRCEDASAEACELKEAALHALSSIVQFCARDVRAQRDEIGAIAIASLRYDPNYADDDEDMGGADDREADGDADDDDDEDAVVDDDDGGFEDDYADDDDMSWKVRRMAARCLAALFAAYPEQIAALYGTTARALVARFKEREDAVRLEIFETYSQLLRITASHDADIIRRDALAVATTLVRSLKGSSVAVRGGVFQTLCALCRAAPVTPELVGAVTPAACECLRDASAANALRIDALRLLQLTVAEANAVAVLPYARTAVDVLVLCLADRYYRVVAEALRVADGAAGVLAHATPPLTAEASDLFAAVRSRLKALDQDQEVKDLAIRAATALVSRLGSDLGADATQDVVPTLLNRCGTETTRLPAVRALGILASSTAPTGLDAHLGALFETLAGFLRKVDRSLRHAALVTLAALLQRHGALAVSQGLVEGPLGEARPLISDDDLLLAASALELATAALKALLLLAAPSPAVDATRAGMQAGLQAGAALATTAAAAVSLSTSTLLRGAAHDALCDFFCALRAASAPGLGFEDLRSTLLETGTRAPRASQRSVAECVAALCRDNEGDVASTLKLSVSALEDDNAAAEVQCIMLLVIGELGRVADLSRYPEISTFVTRALMTSSGDVKGAASLALGGIAAGNLAEFLPFLLARVAEQPSEAGSQKQLYLLLKSLNEVLRTLLSRAQPPTQQQQREIIELLLSKSAVEEECSSMVADCFAQLAFLSPGEVAPRLRELLEVESPETRGVAVAAVRYMVGDSSRDCDERVQEMLPSFLHRMTDPDHTVRKQAVQLLSVCAHTRPNLLRSHLADAQPQLLALTAPDASLMRQVDLGPFKETRDDGLSLRKHAFECLETLLARASFVQYLSLSGIAAALVSGLGDDKGIRRTCHAILVQLCTIAPSQVLAVLERLIKPLSQTLSANVKDDAIPQVKERHAELLKSTLTAVQALNNIPEATTMVPAFKSFLDQKVVNNPKVAHLWQAVEANGAK